MISLVLEDSSESITKMSVMSEKSNILEMSDQESLSQQSSVLSGNTTLANSRTNHGNREEKKQKQESDDDVDDYSYDDDDDSDDDNESFAYSERSSTTGIYHNKSNYYLDNSRRNSSEDSKTSIVRRSKPGPYSKAKLIRDYNLTHGSLVRGRKSVVREQQQQHDMVRKIVSDSAVTIKELNSQKAALDSELIELESENKTLRMEVWLQGKEMKDMQPLQDLVLKQIDEIKNLKKKIQRKQVRSVRADEKLKKVHFKLNEKRKEISKTQQLIDKKSDKSIEELQDRNFELQRDLDYAKNRELNLEEEVEKMKIKHSDALKDLKVFNYRNNSYVRELELYKLELINRIKDFEKLSDAQNIYARRQRHPQVSGQTSLINSRKSSVSLDRLSGTASRFKSSIPVLPPLPGATRTETKESTLVSESLASSNETLEGKQDRQDRQDGVMKDWKDRRGLYQQTKDNQRLQDQSGDQDVKSGGQQQQQEKQHKEKQEEKLSAEEIEKQKNEIKRRLNKVDADLKQKSDISDKVSLNNMTSDVNESYTDTEADQKSDKKTNKEASLISMDKFAGFVSRKQPIEGEDLPIFGNYKPSFTAAGRGRGSVGGGGDRRKESGGHKARETGGEKEEERIIEKTRQISVSESVNDDGIEEIIDLS